MYITPHSQHNYYAEVYNMVMKLDIKKLLKNIAIPLAVGGVSGFLTSGGVEEFTLNAEKPFFTPPGWLFPVAWTILYTLMGISAYLIEATQTTKDKKTAFILYYLQLFFNFVWSFIFFNAGNYLFAFIWIAILWVLILATTVEFHKINPKAAYLMIPYIIWVAFAAVLNFSVYLLN